jgi:hypothetical protein
MASARPGMVAATIRSLERATPPSPLERRGAVLRGTRRRAAGRLQRGPRPGRHVVSLGALRVARLSGEASRPRSARSLVGRRLPAANDDHQLDPTCFDRDVRSARSHSDDSDPHALRNAVVRPAMCRGAGADWSKPRSQAAFAGPDRRGFCCSANRRFRLRPSRSQAIGSSETSPCHRCGDEDHNSLQRGFKARTEPDAPVFRRFP